MSGAASRGLRGALSCLFLAVGCSSQDSPGSAASGSAGAPSEAGAAEDAGWSCQDATGLDLSGTWAVVLDLKLDLVNQTGGAVTLCPAHQSNHATLYLLIRGAQQPNSSAVSLEPVFCSMELPALTAMVGQCDPSATNGLIVDLLLSDKLQQALPSIPCASQGATLASLLPGAAFQAERFTFTAGTRKLGAAMPSWQGNEPGCGAAELAPGRGPVCESSCVDDCAALVDDDHDGRTGVTFHVCGYTQDDLQSGLQCNAANPSEAAIAIQGPILMDFQLDPLLQGTALSSCEVRGTVDTQVIYHVVGGDLYVANSQISVLSAMKSLPLFTVDAAQSRFRMVRVDGLHGAPDWKIGADPSGACAAVLQHRNDLL